MPHKPHELRDVDSLTRDMVFLDREFREVVDRHFHLKLGHDLESVAKLDALFDQGPLRKIAQDDERNVAVMLAAYLGETVRALARGGRWQLEESLGPCIVDLPSTRGSVRVLARAQRRIHTGGPELLLSLVTRAVAQQE